MMVLSLSVDDYSNFAHDQSNALRSVGVDCEDLKLLNHGFGYPTQSRIVSLGEMRKAMRAAKIIQIFHSDSSLLPHCTGKRIVVWHTGTRYRQQPEKFNRIFNPHVQKSIIALGEFAGLGAKGETYLCGAIDTDRIRPSDIENEKLVIGHFPSNPSVKGTEVINQVVSELTGDFTYLHSTTQVSYTQQLERMNQCDVYIELLAPLQDGKPYGSFGITGLEAMAMNKILVTQCPPQYEKTYGESPLIFVKDREGLKRELQSLINTGDPGSITRPWCLQNHSYKAAGAKLKAVLGI